MTTGAPSRIQKTIGRIRAIWAELGYAQRRLLEVQTGLPLFEARKQ
jgi:hypothetical protein